MFGCRLPGKLWRDGVGPRPHGTHEFAESLRHGAPESSQQAVFAAESAVIAALLTAGGEPKVPVVGNQYLLEYRRVALRAHPHLASRPTAEMEYGEYTVLGVWADPDGVCWLGDRNRLDAASSPHVPWL